MRILPVEDDTLIGSGLQQGLQREGFAVDWAQTGDTAALALRTTSYGLVLLDLGLPGQDGLTLLARLRQRNDDTPVIIITARDAVPDRVAGLDGGADDYVVKPFALDELLARMRVVRRRQAGRSSLPRNSSIDCCGEAVVSLMVRSCRRKSVGPGWRRSTRRRAPGSGGRRQRHGRPRRRSRRYARKAAAPRRSAGSGNRSAPPGIRCAQGSRHCSPRRPPRDSR